ncbi:MAG: hypothetical protein IJH80_00160 [Ruminococcus sp.]|nr:hypothetical protein [Ruminococcus sp.]
MPNNQNTNFKEAVCLEAMRVFDSCSSQDCLEDLAVTFDTAAQTTLDAASYVKTKCIEVTQADFTVTPVAFNRGFFTVDCTYTFQAEIDAYTADSTSPTVIYGETTFTKTVILYGSDAGTKRFSSGFDPAQPAEAQVSGCASCCTSTLPTATVNVAQPMCLSVSFTPAAGEQGAAVSITIGIFSIIQLTRPVSMLLPSYDYCIPGKECQASDDTPCEMFSKISFPTNEFFPQGIEQCGCNSSQNNNVT